MIQSVKELDSLFRPLYLYFKTELSPETLALYYHPLKDFSKGILYQAIHKVIAEASSARFPLVSEILDACTSLSSNPPFSTPEDEVFFCDMCGGIGVTIKEDKDGYKKACPCLCSRGQAVKDRWRRYLRTYILKEFPTQGASS